MLVFHNASKYIILNGKDACHRYIKINKISIGFRYIDKCKIHHVSRIRIVFEEKTKISIFMHPYDTYYQRLSLYLAIEKQNNQYKLFHVSCDEVNIALDDKIVNLYYTSQPVRHHVYNVETKETVHSTFGFNPIGQSIKYYYDEKYALTKYLYHMDTDLTGIMIYYDKKQISKIVINNLTYIKV